MRRRRGWGREPRRAWRPAGSEPGLGRTLARGAVAGLVATWATARLDVILHRRESWAVRQRETRAERAAQAGPHGEHGSPIEALADRLADGAGIMLSHRGERALGRGLRY